MTRDELLLKLTLLQSTITTLQGYADEEEESDIEKYLGKLDAVKLPRSIRLLELDCPVSDFLADSAPILTKEKVKRRAAQASTRKPGQITLGQRIARGDLKNRGCSILARGNLIGMYKLMTKHFGAGTFTINKVGGGSYRVTRKP